jgi:transposase
MATPLSDCTIKEQHTIVHFLWVEEVKSAEIHRQMLAQYGAHIMHQQKIYEWIERFMEGRTSVTDESRPGRPSTSRMDQHIQRADILIREDRRTHVSTGSACMVTSSKWYRRGFLSNQKASFKKG